MREKILPGCLLIVSLSACAGNSLAPKNNDQISVNSEPSGASVYVMGKRVGLTPAVVDVSAVYPVTYSQEEVQRYGHITLKHEGCSDQTIKVSTGMVSSGLKVDLDCQVKQKPGVELPPLADKSVRQRLQELQVLKDEGLVSEQEYQDIRIRILQSL